MSQADRDRWNAKFAAAADAAWVAHPIVAEVAGAGAGARRVLELAAGRSGSALALAAAGAQVTAVDISEVALAQLAAEAAARGLHLELVAADLDAWEPPAQAFDLVLATRFWDAGVFARAARAVAPGGTLAWEAFTLAERRYRPGFGEAYCLRDDEPAARLPPGFVVVRSLDLDDGASATRRLIARREAG